VRATAIFSSALVLSLALACGGEKEQHDQDSLAVEPGLAPRAEPEPEPEVEPPPEPEVEPEPEPEPELSERKQALANVGRAAFDALQAGDFEALLELTPLVEGYLRERCGELPVAPRKELQARFDHCHKAIEWSEVAEAQVFAGKPTGAAATGCMTGVEDYGRLQLFLHMNDAQIWRVDFYGAVGEAGNAIGISGEVSCREVDEAPELR
jgi:hypothetical protein